jgi:hypothetical protein
LEGKPFVLLGICTSLEKDGLRKLIESGEVTWRCWHAEQGSSIAQEWRPQYLPRTYVLDHKGVIRFKGLQGKKLDEAVDQLLRELETEKKT